MQPHRPPVPTQGETSPSDAEIRAIAQQIVGEVSALPAANPGDRLLATRHELAPADEERVDTALVALGAAVPEVTMRAHREAAGDAEPRPKSWALDGDTPDSAVSHPPA